MKLRIPFTFQQYSLSPRPLITLSVRDRYGLYAHVQFIVDTGADVTTIPISVANSEQIPFSKENPGSSSSVTGQVVKYRGRIHVRIAGKEHTWPCDFAEAPMIADSVASSNGMKLSVLGRLGFLDQYAISIDSNFLVIARLGTLRRLWRRVLHTIWAVSRATHAPEEPL